MRGFGSFGELLSVALLVLRAISRLGTYEKEWEIVEFKHE
jgi:hypothetical protein